MKKSLFFFKSLSFIFCLHVFSSFSQNFEANDLVGQWLVQEKTAVITFFADRDKYFGMTSWLQQPKDGSGKLLTDVNNPDPSKRSMPLLGALLCRNFVYDENGVWVDGTIYDSRTGNTYSCKITMRDKNTITVRGYIGISLVGGSTVWTRKE